MRDLTLTELDYAVAEQLPPRELMGSSGWKSGDSAQANTTQNGLINVNNFQLLAFGSNNGQQAYA